jgi:hypothetical protein
LWGASLILRIGEFVEAGGEVAEQEPAAVSLILRIGEFVEAHRRRR